MFIESFLTPDEIKELEKKFLDECKETSIICKNFCNNLMREHYGMRMSHSSYRDLRKRILGLKKLNIKRWSFKFGIGYRTTSIHFIGRRTPESQNFPGKFSCEFFEVPEMKIRLPQVVLEYPYKLKDGLILNEFADRFILESRDAIESAITRIQRKKIEYI